MINIDGFLNFLDEAPHIHTAACGERKRRIGGLVDSMDATQMDAEVAFDLMIYCASAAHNAAISEDWKKAKAFREQYQLWAEIGELAAMRDAD